jgi:hypothetical protein
MEKELGDAVRFAFRYFPLTGARHPHLVHRRRRTPRGLRRGHAAGRAGGRVVPGRRLSVAGGHRTAARSAPDL